MEKYLRPLIDYFHTEILPANYDQLVEVFGRVVPECNVYLVDDEGNLLGFCQQDDISLVEEQWVAEGTILELLDKYASIHVCKELVSGKDTLVNPLKYGGTAVGTLCAVSLPDKITKKHELISEYMGGILSLLLGKELAGVEQSKLRVRIQARKALQALSYSEIITLQRIFTCLDVNYEGFFVAGEVAAELGITRSVIVNALKKLRSANILESRSLGMKGTFVRVLNQEIIEMVNSHDYRSLQSLQKN